MSKETTNYKVGDKVYHDIQGYRGEVVKVTSRTVHIKYLICTMKRLNKESYYYANHFWRHLRIL